MIACLFAVFFLVASFARADDFCNMNYRYQGYTLSSFMPCLNAPQIVSEEIITRTCDSIKEFLELNVFLDIAAKPPAPYEHLALDLRTEISNHCDKALANYRDATAAKMSAWQFHEGIAHILRNLKDAHSVYVKPAWFGNFRIAFPLMFDVKDANHVKFILAPESRAIYVDYYNKLYNANVTKYVDREIATINGKSPMVYLRDWANDVVYATKSVHGRVNHALTGDFYLRTPKVHGVDETAGEKPLDIVFADGTTATIHFFITLVSNPIRSSAEAQAQYNKTEEPYLMKYTSAGKNSNLITEKERREKERELLRERFLQRKFIRELESERAFTPTGDSSVKSSNNENKRSVADAIGDLIADGEDERMFIQLIGDEVFDLYLVDTTNTKIRTILGSAILKGSENVEPKLKNNKIYVLSIKSFSPNDIISNANNFRVAFDIMHGDISHLIISVVGNGGGWVSLGALVARSIFPSLFPINGQYNIRKNRIADALIRLQNENNFFSMRRTSFYTGNVITRGDETDMTDWYDEGITMSFVNPATGNEYKQEFSSLFSFDDDGELSISEALSQFYSFPGLDLPPNRVALVTDAGCGSTCACFSKHIAETHRAVLYGLGGDIDTNAEPYDVASFAGGTVEDTDSIVNVIDGMFIPSQEEKERGVTEDMKREHVRQVLADDSLYELLSNIGFPSSCYMRYAFHQIFSWKYNEYDPVDRLHHPLEFVPVPVHTVLPIWPSFEGWQSVEGITKFVPTVIDSLMQIGENDEHINDTNKKLKKALDADGVIFQKYEARTPSNKNFCNGGNEGLHIRGGYHYADADANDAEKTCSFYDCAPGYYLKPINDDPYGLDDYNETCIKREDEHESDYKNAHIDDINPADEEEWKRKEQEQEEARKQSEARAKSFRTGLIVVAVIMIVVLAVAITFVVLYVSKKKRYRLIENNDASETQHLCEGEEQLLK